MEYRLRTSIQDGLATTMMWKCYPEYRDGYSTMNAVAHIRWDFRRAWDRMHARQRRRDRETTAWVDIGGEA